MQLGTLVKIDPDVVRNDEQLRSLAAGHKTFKIIRVGPLNVDIKCTGKSQLRTIIFGLPRTNVTVVG